MGCYLLNGHPLDRRDLWFMSTGGYVSNNWFKMHGGVLCRKRHLRRRKEL